MSQLPLREALATLRAARGERDVVITTMGPSREWMALGQTQALDLVYVPAAMSHATSLGLGLALAQPTRRIIVVNGEGSMLMNLGSLVSITAANPSNLIVIVCDNGVYEVTGAQPTPSAPAGRTGGDALDWIALARAAGFRSVFAFAELDEWGAGLPGALAARGPTFIWLPVAGDPAAGGPRSPGPAAERGRAFMAAIQE